MKDAQIVERLMAWDEDESINRAVFRALRGEGSLEEVRRRWPEDNYFLQVALDPSKYPDTVPAAYLLAEDRSVAVSKHPRYNRMPLHIHDYFELNYVVCGNCVQRFEDGAASLTEGDLCLLSPDARHRIEAFDDGAIVLNLAIRTDSFLQQFSNLSRKDSAISSFFMGNLYSRKKLRYLLVHGAGDAEVRHMALQMYGEALHRDAYTDDILAARMTILFNLLLRNHSGRMEAPSLRQTRNPTTDAILSYIHSHSDEVTLQQVAEAFHFSRQYCSRLIMELTGCTFSELLTGFRIGKGEELLLHTHLSVEEISARVGYANPETFIRAFRRVRGVSPGQMRRHSRQS